MDYLRIAVEANRTLKDVAPKLQGFVVAAKIANTSYLIGMVLIAFIVAAFAYVMIKKII